jgi:hypothetical protein
MERPLLNDPKEFPADQVLARCLGPAKGAWDAFMAMLRDDYPLVAVEWRYYNDGKSWLCKVTRKTQTLAWVAAWENYFSTAFYLNARAEDLVRASSLDKALKDSFLHPDKETKFRAIRVEVRKKSDLAAVKEVLGIKLQLK